MCMLNLTHRKKGLMSQTHKNSVELERAENGAIFSGYSFSFANVKVLEICCWTIRLYLPVQNVYFKILKW